MTELNRNLKTKHLDLEQRANETNYNLKELHQTLALANKIQEEKESEIHSLNKKIEEISQKFEANRNAEHVRYTSFKEEHL